MLMIRKQLQIVLLENVLAAPGSHKDDDPAEDTDSCHSPGIEYLNHQVKTKKTTLSFILKYRKEITFY